MATFAGIFFLDPPFPSIILVAGLSGFNGSRLGVSAFLVGGGLGATWGKVLAATESACGVGPLRSPTAHIRHLSLRHWAAIGQSVHHPAQQESFATSFEKASAASFNP